MKTRYYALAALASLAFASCAPVYDTDNLPIIPEPEPEIVYEGSGTLYNGDPASAKATNSTYSWKADGDVISINVSVDTDEYAETGGYEIGHFNLDAASIGDFLGVSVTDLNNDVFTPIQPDGSTTSWTSYEPGMWVNADGEGCGWSEGSLYWQWYIYSGTSYDYDYASNKGMLMIGGNPSNTPKCAGSTITSKAKITLGDRTVDFIVTVKFEGAYEAPTEPEAKMDYLTDGNGYPYQAAAYGNHQFMWIMSEDGITVNVDAHIPSIEDWVYLMIGIDPEALTSYLGIDDLSKLADFDYFYPVDAEGNKGEKWTTGYIGNWVTEEGAPCTWADGRAYWFFNFGDNKYEGHYTDGLLCVGTNPGNIAELDGKTVTSKAVIGDKTFTVNVTYHDDLLTSGAGVIGANSYAWELTEDAMNVKADISLANIDGDSWGLLGFPINAAYVNEYYDINLDELTIEDFYPVDAEGNPGEKWTSYAPGQWFKADGSAGAWDTGIAFWQYYNASTYDYDLPNLFYLGKNPGIAAEEYEIGASYVSKAKLAGRDFIVTINVVE